MQKDATKAHDIHVVMALNIKAETKLLERQLI